MSYTPQVEQDIVNSLASGKSVSCVHPMDSSMKIKERMLQSNKYKQSLTSLSFGSTQIALNIPKGSVVNGVWLNMGFQGTNSADTLAAICAYACISQVQYRFGNSTMYSMSGADLFQIVRSTLYTKDQVDELIDIAGGAVPFNVGIGVKTACAWIHLPYSRLNNGLKLRYGIDTAIMDAPLTILIDFHPASRVYTVNTGANSALASGFFHISGADYFDKQQQIVPKDNEYFSFPCHYYQSFACPSATAGSTTATISQSLTSFRKGNLLGIFFYAVLNTDRDGTAPFKTVQLNSFKVIFNGVVIYQSDNDPDIRMMNLTQNLMPAQYVAYSQTNKVTECIFANVAPRYKNFSNVPCLNLANQILTVEYSINSTSAHNLNAIYVYDSAVVYNQTSAELVL